MLPASLPKTWVLGICLLAATATADTLIDGDSFVQNEISLTTVPGQPGKLVMAYNDNPYPNSGAGLGIAHRQSAGGAWATTFITYPTATQVPGTPKMIWSFDPTITADSSGNVYAGFISAGASSNLGVYDSGLYVAKSTDYGQNWQPAVEVDYDAPPTGSPDALYRFNDRCQITCDTVSTGSYAGNLYVSWIKDRGYQQAQPWSDIYFATSSDGGQTWTYPNPAATGEFLINDNPGTDLANIPIPTVAADGTVYVAWLDYNVQTSGLGRIMVDKSTNGGTTWGTDVQARQIQLPPLSVTTNAPAQDALAKGGTPIAASPTNANELYIVYAEDVDPTDSDEGDIFLIKTADGGATWSSPVTVNHDDGTLGDNILPWIDVKPNGTIDVAWYDRRNDAANDVLWDVYIARSVDGGATFSGNVRLTDSSFATPGNLWLGEYLGLAADNTNAYVAWTSSLSDASLGDIYFDQIPNANIPEPAALALLGLGALAALRKRR